MRRMWHLLPALTLVGALLVVVLGVDIAADQHLLPSWEFILTRPAGELLAYGSGHAEAPAVQVVTTQPVLPAPPVSAEPLRVAGRPADPSGAVEAVAGPNSQRSREAVPYREAKAPVARADSPLPTTRDEPHLLKAGLAADSDQGSEPGPTKEFVAAEASKDLAQLLATGGELVRNGVKLPRLIADWSLEDIEALIRSGEGLVVAEGEGQLYRIVLDEGPLLETQEFRVLTPEVRKRVSNRGVCLNCGSQRDALGEKSPFYHLEQEFLQRVGGASNTQHPHITFFPSGGFDSYLGRKQLGAIASAGVDLSKPEQLQGAVSTVGTIVLTSQGARYLIREIRVGDRVQPWQDPEAALVAGRS